MTKMLSRAVIDLDTSSVHSPVSPRMINALPGSADLVKGFTRKTHIALPSLHFLCSCLTTSHFVQLPEGRYL